MKISEILSSMIYDEELEDSQKYFVECYEDLFLEKIHNQDSIFDSLSEKVREILKEIKLESGIYFKAYIFKDEKKISLYLKKK